MKINDEEKRAITLLKQLDNFDDLCKTCYYIETERKQKYGCEYCREEAKDIVLDLIEKLQKENKKLKNKLLDTLKGQKVIKEETPQYIKENYISKQKIKDKIEEVRRMKFRDYCLNGATIDFAVMKFKELLEESEK